MLKTMGVNNTVLIILVIFLGAISGEFIRMVKKNNKNNKNNSLNYKKINLCTLISSISRIIGVVLSFTIYFQMNV